MNRKFVIISLCLLLFLIPVGVSIAQNTTVIDDFEDGDITIETSGWSGWSGSTSSFSVESANPISGSHSGNLTVTNDNLFVSATPDSQKQSDNITVTMRVGSDTGGSGGNQDSVAVQVRNNNDLLFRVLTHDGTGGDIVASDGGGQTTLSETWSAGTPLTVRFFDIDYDTETYSIEIDGDTQATGLGFDSSASGYDELQFANDLRQSGDTRSAYIDDVSVTDVGGITGTVTNSRTGNPIEGANVTATTILEDTRTVSETTTDADGEFLIEEDLTTAEYTVFTIKSPEYWPNFVTVSHTAGTTTDAGTIEMEPRGPGVTGAYPRSGVYERNRTSDAFNYTFTLKQPISENQSDTATVDVFWKNDTTGSFESIHQDTVTETDGSVSFDFENPTDANPSLNEWFVSVQVDRGTFNSSTYQYFTPGNITLVNASTNQQITDSEITGTFRSIDSDFETTKQTQSTGTGTWDGVIDMNDIPREDYIVTLESTGGDSYDTRSYVVSDGSVTSLLTAGLVNSSTFQDDPAWYTQSFELEDNTGQWNPRNVFLLLEQRVDGEYQAVTGDVFGVQNEVSLAVNDTESYRMTLLHAVRGDERNVGVFNADRDESGETVTITIDSTAPPPDENDEGYKVSAELLNATDESIPAVFRVTYNDPEEETVDFNFTIYERDNPSNIIIEDVGSDQLGSAVFTIQNDSVLANQTWIVDWQATRDGEHINGTIVVGPDRQTTDLPIPDNVKHGVSFIVLVLTGGLVGGRAGSENGAVVVAIVGGILWYIDFMPNVVGAGVVTLALFVAILFNAKVDGRSP